MNSASPQNQDALSQLEIEMMTDLYNRYMCVRPKGFVYLQSVQLEL